MKVKIVAFTGLPMTGKSTAREVFEELLDQNHISHSYVHFGATEEVERRNKANEWPEDQAKLSMEEKEKLIREQWRQELGMGAMAIKKLDEIEKQLMSSKLVLIDNLYSDEERTVLSEKFGEDSLFLVAVVADWKTRVQRGKARQYRPLTEAELVSRDKAEVYNLNKGPTIALANVTILNNSDNTTDLAEQLTTRVLANII